MLKYVDLHLHTTASDGSLSPEELVIKAEKMAFKTISITDHETVNGIKAGIKVAKDKEIELIPGIELNTDYKSSEIHILGYYIDYKNKKLSNKLASLQKARYNRIKKIVGKLNHLGVEIAFEEVKEIAGQATIGRSHVARVILEKGYAKKWNEAFDKYLAFNAAAYVKRNKLSPKEAIKMIKDINGIAVVAHPALIGNDNLLKELIAWGIEGIEVYHTKHSQADSKRYLDFAQKNDLLVTGGSDCHGPDCKNGALLGKVNLADNFLTQLKKYK